MADGYIKLYGKLKSVTEEGKVADYSEIDGAPNVVKTTGDSETDVMSQKAVTDNFARLVNGKVPASQLPSYVDDVVEYDSKSDFPATGEEGKIYVDKSTNSTYRWSGSTYIMIGGGDLNVVQTTGNSETDVMSQNAVTKNFLHAEVSNSEIYINSHADTYVTGSPWKFFNECNFNSNIYVLNNLHFKEYISILNPDTISYEKIYLPAQTGTVVLRPNDLPTETSLVTVSSTGTHAYKKVSDFAQLNNDDSASIFFGSTYLTSNKLSMSSGTTVYTPEGIQKGMMVEGEFTPTTLQFPVVANNPYFALTPNAAPTEPSVVVNAADRTPTWQSAAPILQDYVDDALLGG